MRRKRTLREQVGQERNDQHILESAEATEATGESEEEKTCTICHESAGRDGVPIFVYPKCCHFLHQGCMMQ